MQRLAMRVPMKSERELQNIAQQLKPQPFNGPGNSLQVLQSLQQLQQQQQQLLPAVSQLPVPTGDSNIPSALDSIATAAVSRLASDVDDKEERLRKRRSQIAAASRKSRAKRKKEVNILKQENEKLCTEIDLLKNRLKELGEDINLDAASNDDESGTAEAASSKEKGNEKLKRNLEEMSNSNLNEQGLSKVEKQKLGKIWAEEPMFKVTQDFFQQRLSTYFNQLKADTIDHLAPDAPTSLKDRLKQFEVSLVAPSNEEKKKSKPTKKMKTER